MTQTQRVTKRSRLSHWIDDELLPLSGFSDRIESWKELSPAALQYCIDREWAYIDGNNNVAISSRFESNMYENDILFSNARRLGILFGEMKVEDILLSLGIRDI